MRHFGRGHQTRNGHARVGVALLTTMICDVETGETCGNDLEGLDDYFIKRDDGLAYRHRKLSVSTRKCLW